MKLRLGAKNVTIAALLFLVLFIPTIIIGLYYYQSINTNLTNQVFSQRTTVASLSASAIKVKLDQLSALTIQYATAPAIVSEAGNGDWQGVKNTVINLENNPQYYDYYIDRILVLDATGTVQGAYPGIAAAGIGKPDDAIAEWYGPLVQDGASSFVSNVYTRSVAPNTNQIEILAPIKNGSQITGFIELDIPINEFSDFCQDANIGSDGYVYIVDRLGQIVSSPKYSSNGSIVNYSTHSVVQAVISGASGTAVGYNTLEAQNRVVAYQPVPTYGWGVVATEPTDEAFASRDSILHDIRTLLIFFSVIELIFALLMLYLFDHPHKTRLPKSKKAKGGFTLIELLVVIAIIAILSVVVILTINPSELLRQSRDSSRISDMSTLRTAVALYLSSVTSYNLASSSFGYSACYLSTKSGNGTTTTKCGVFLLTGSSTNASASAASYQNIDSTGWVPVNFSQISAGTPFSALPVDPTNNGTYYYAYAATSSGGFEFAATMESQKYGKGGSASVVTTGSIYEVGSNLNL